ncbi:MAG: hypothetical protein MHM6MM_002618 [Cercozoa sp. M6MM]
MSGVRTLEEILGAGAQQSGGPDAAADALEFDLGHLCAIDARAFEERPDEETLRARACQNMQALVQSLLQLPSEASEHGAGRVCMLPTPLAKLPREKPCPTGKAATPWEEFARRKGIQKKKRSQKVFDESTQEWVPRWGYGRAGQVEDHVVEHAENEAPLPEGARDVFEARALKKAELKQRNRQQRQDNLERAGGKNALPGEFDVASAINRVHGDRPNKKRRKHSHLDASLRIAQHATASMGKFDKRARDESQRRAHASRRSRGQRQPGAKGGRSQGAIVQQLLKRDSMRREAQI